MIAAFMKTRLGRALAAVGALLAALAGAWLLGDRARGKADKAKAQEAENEKRKRMADAAAKSPADRDSLVDRLRDGEF